MSSTNLSTLTDPVAFDSTTAKGKPNHLFRACMKAIRSAHFRSNRIRASLIVSGLLTDRLVYREVISVFYVLTSEVENKLFRDSNFGTTQVDKEIIQKLVSLGYAFTEAYEKDLLYLYNNDPDWQKQVQSIMDGNPAARHYRQKIQTMTRATEIAGAVFCLWGALVIGGGAAVRPRVQSLCGAEATHIYETVTGPGRDERKRHFVTTWDSLAARPKEETSNGTTTTTTGGGGGCFEEIVAASQECMQCNNNVLSSLQRNPWWLKYVVVMILLTALYLVNYFMLGNMLLKTKDDSQDL